MAGPLLKSCSRNVVIGRCWKEERASKFFSSVSRQAAASAGLSMERMGSSMGWITLGGLGWAKKDLAGVTGEREGNAVGDLSNARDDTDER